MGDSIFDENGVHKLSPFKAQVTTKITIDFWEECVRIYIIFMQKSKQENSAEKLLIENILTAKRNHRILNKKFKVSEDYKSVQIDGFVYDIPSFFNKEMIKNNDEKTWHMIFYQIFSNEIHEALSQVLMSKEDRR